MATAPANPFAFPSPDDGRPSDGYGMELRDYFAAKAPQPKVAIAATTPTHARRLGTPSPTPCSQPARSRSLIPHLI
jgi:hypothetical protein